MYLNLHLKIKINGYVPKFEFRYITAYLNLQMFAPMLFVYCVYTIIICLIIAVYNLSCNKLTNYYLYGVIAIKTCYAHFLYTLILVF